MKRRPGLLQALGSAAILLSLSGCGADSAAEAETGSIGSAGGAHVGGAGPSGGSSAGGLGGGAAVAGAGGAAEMAGVGGAGAGSGGSGGSANSGGAVSSGGAGGNSNVGGNGNAAGAGGVSAGKVPSQAGNPVYGLLGGYRAWLSTAAGESEKLAADRKRADNMLTWQLPHGGFYKNKVTVYDTPWNGTDARAGWTGAGGIELGTIDNGGSVTELMFLADVYRRSADTKYRDAARRVLSFLLTMQYPSGGFPQVYPERPGSYSNYVTFNDDAMVRVMILLQQSIDLAPPLAGDLFTDEQRAKLPSALAKGFEYILAAQIVQGGTKTVWCAQHDPTTYAPLGARAYELPSKSGSESVGVVTLLLTQPQTSSIQAAVQAAVAWYKKVGMPNMAYVGRPAGSTDDTYDPIQPKAGATLWFRFYDLDQDTGFFSGRLPTDNPPGAGKQYDLMKVEPERRYGYQWGGAYGTKLFAYASTVGY